MLSIVCTHHPQPNRNPRGSLQLKKEPLVRRDCGPRGDVCRSLTMEGLKSGPQTLQRFLSLASRGVKPGLMARSLRGALLARGVRNRFQMSGRPERPKPRINEENREKPTVRSAQTQTTSRLLAKRRQREQRCRFAVRDRTRHAQMNLHAAPGAV